AELPEFIDYSSNPEIISPILEKIAGNPVGKLTLCLLYQARHNMPKERLKIFVDERAPEYVKDEYGKRINVGGKQTQFCHNDFCIYLNFHQIINNTSVVYFNVLFEFCSYFVLHTARFLMLRKVVVKNIRSGLAFSFIISQ
ncbi:MAG: hypothetical protein IJT08_00650, partial [Alphaproteobacteria bacterium]|nr:hypothetical protein [Alphaproteobacteria bacterium]